MNDIKEKTEFYGNRLAEGLEGKYVQRCYTFPVTREYASWDPEYIELVCAFIGSLGGSREYRMEHHTTGLSCSLFLCNGRPNRLPFVGRPP